MLTPKDNEVNKTVNIEMTLLFSLHQPTDQFRYGKWFSVDTFARFLHIYGAETSEQRVLTIRP